MGKKVEKLDQKMVKRMQYVGRSVMHFLTPYGQKIYKFFKIIS